VSRRGRFIAPSTSFGVSARKRSASAGSGHERLRRTPERRQKEQQCTRRDFRLHGDLLRDFPTGARGRRPILLAVRGTGPATLPVPAAAPFTARRARSAAGHGAARGRCSEKTGRGQPREQPTPSAGGLPSRDSGGCCCKNPLVRKNQPQCRKGNRASFEPDPTERPILTGREVGGAQITRRVPFGFRRSRGGRRP
jgi:hypothetical protein